MGERKRQPASGCTSHETSFTMQNSELDKLPRPGMQEAAARHLAELRKQLRRERALGKAGHWGYDLTRHLALKQKVRRAEAALGRGRQAPGIAGTSRARA